MVKYASVGTLKIEYDVKENEFYIDGNLSPEGQREIVENFLRKQIGAGEDASIANIRDSYTITLEWDPSNDSIGISSDTGNDGLRDGILMCFLKEMED